MSLVVLCPVVGEFYRYEIGKVVSGDSVVLVVAFSQCPESHQILMLDIDLVYRFLDLFPGWNRYGDLGH